MHSLNILQAFAERIPIAFVGRLGELVSAVGEMNQITLLSRYRHSLIPTRISKLDVLRPITTLALGNGYEWVLIPARGRACKRRRDMH